jgi:hypothetical protein
MEAYQHRPARQQMEILEEALASRPEEVRNDK